MTKKERKKLRELAEKCLKLKTLPAQYSGDHEDLKFMFEVANPQTILSLLDRLDVMQEALERIAKQDDTDLDAPIARAALKERGE